MAIQRQTTWGGKVILDMFLGGIGAGVFAVSFLLIFLGGITKVAHIGILIGPVLMIAGLFFLILELGSPMNMLRIFSGLSSSWMSRGALVQTLFIILGLAYAIPAFWSDSWLSTSSGLTIGTIAFILALVTAIYHGLFLSKAKGIVLWSSPVLPLATTLTALCTGIGLMLLVLLAYQGSYPKTELLITFKFLGYTGAAFIVGELVLLWSLLSLQPNVTYNESIRKIGVHIAITTACLLFSLALLISGLLIGEVTYISVASILSGILLLASGFIIRFALIRAGHYPSMYQPLSQ